LDRACRRCRAGGNSGLFFAIGPHFSSTLTFPASRKFFYLLQPFPLYMANNSRQLESSANEFYAAVFASRPPVAGEGHAAKNPAIRSMRLRVSILRRARRTTGGERIPAAGVELAGVIRNLSDIR
jgi:hypothetical protein